jgi:hypothetical protein
LQTCDAQLDFALAASPPHVVNFASQRLAQTSAEAGLVVAPDVPEEPVGVPDVDDEHPTAASANEERAKTSVERENEKSFMR